MYIGLVFMFLFKIWVIEVKQNIMHDSFYLKCCQGLYYSTAKILKQCECKYPVCSFCAIFIIRYFVFYSMRLVLKTAR